MNVFQLGRAAPRQLGVQVLPSPAERLPPLGGFLPQPLAVEALQPRQQLLVEAIAIGGNPRQQRGQRHRRIVRVRTCPADSGGHDDRARHHRRRLEQQLVRVQLPATRAVRFISASSVTCWITYRRYRPRLSM